MHHSQHNINLIQIYTYIISTHLHLRSSPRGLRAIKSVLVIMGVLKRAESEDSPIGEESLVMRALRDFNAPKIVEADQVWCGVVWCSVV